MRLQTNRSESQNSDFGEEYLNLAEGDAVVLAVPPLVAASLLPGLQTPTEFRAIVNIHFRFDPPAGVSSSPVL